MAATRMAALSQAGWSRRQASSLQTAGEKSGKPSQSTLFKRTSVHKLGISTPPDNRLPDAIEQAVGQGGHLLLAAAEGVVYAATVNDDAAILPSGVFFRLAFNVVMNWITGPLLGVKSLEWQSDAGAIGMQTLKHVAFGLVIGTGASLAAVPESSGGREHDASSPMIAKSGSSISRSA